MLELTLIRHGKTQGNLEKRYIGRTDEPLCSEGKTILFRDLETHRYPPIQKLYVSPMLRCIQSAEIIYPEHTYTAINDFREMDFGDFENKSYADLKEDTNYKRFLESEGRFPIPNGESRQSFSDRVCIAFENTVEQLLSIKLYSAAFIVHGGTIMSILERYAVTEKDGMKKGYYDYQIDNGGLVKVTVDSTVWQAKRLVLVCSQQP